MKVNYKIRKELNIKHLFINSILNKNKWKYKIKKRNKMDHKNNFKH